MMVILLKLTLRNLIEHRTKTLIVGILISFSIALIVIANSLVDNSYSGCRAFFVKNLTGDIMVCGNKDDNFSIFGPISIDEDTPEIPTIPRYKKVYKYLESLDDIDQITSQVTGFGLVNYNEEPTVFLTFFGIEPDSYWRMFDNITIQEGRVLKNRELGVLLSNEFVMKFEDDYDIRLKAGDNLVLSGYGTFGFNIREVPIRGIFNMGYKNPIMEKQGFIDVHTLRSLQDMVLNTIDRVELSEEETSLLSVENIDELFSGEAAMTDDYIIEQNLDDARINLDLIGNESDEHLIVELDTGAWNFILIKLKNKSLTDLTILKINKWMDENGINAGAYDWSIASTMKTVIGTFEAVFNITIFIITFVAVIIIINTLVVSIIRRTTEIGTMRALGAKKSFVRIMFVMETLITSIVFGCIGIILGAIILWVIGLLHLEANSSIIMFLFGGPVLRPSVSGPAVIIAVIIMIIIGLFASLWPVKAALKVKPIRAIKTE